MKRKLQVGYVKGLIIITACVAIILFLKMERGINVVQFGVGLIEILIVILGAGYIVKRVAQYYTCSIKSVHSCGVPLFDELDYYKHRWGDETNEYYCNIINIIAFYYKKGGKVDTVVGNDLDGLYKRLQFLKRQLGTNDYFANCISSLGISVCASIIYENQSDNYKWYKVIIFIAVFVAVFLVRYYKPFYENNDPTYEYEIKLLETKITEAQNKILVECPREDIFLTKQNILNILINKVKGVHGAKRKDIIRDIEAIEKLNLNLNNASCFYELQFKMGRTKKKGVLFLDEKNNVANEQYQILYKILRKYRLIYEIE